MTEEKEKDIIIIDDTTAGVDYYPYGKPEDEEKE